MCGFQYITPFFQKSSLWNEIRSFKLKKTTKKQPQLLKLLHFESLLSRSEFFLICFVFFLFFTLLLTISCMCVFIFLLLLKHHIFVWYVVVIYIVQWEGLIWLGLFFMMFHGISLLPPEYVFVRQLIHPKSDILWIN